VRAPNPTPETLGALSGLVVVTPRAGPLADFIRKNALAVNLVVTEDYEESLARVMAGQAAAAALNASAGGRIAARLQTEMGRAVKSSAVHWISAELPRRSSAKGRAYNALISEWHTGAVSRAAAGRPPLSPLRHLWVPDQPSPSLPAQGGEGAKAPLSFVRCVDPSPRRADRLHGRDL
jgi:hypothetical protein